MNPSTRLIAALALAIALAGCAAVGGHDRSVVEPLGAALTFRVDEDSNRLVVVDTLGEADWGRIEVTVSSCVPNAAGAVPIAGSGSSPWINEVAHADSSAVLASPATEGACGTPKGTVMSDASRLVLPGDYIDFCAKAETPEGPPLTSILVELRDTATGASLDGYTFADFAPC